MSNNVNFFGTAWKKLVSKFSKSNSVEISKVVDKNTAHNIYEYFNHQN